MTPETTWLVTGANGFLGKNVGAFLRGKVHAVGASREFLTHTPFANQIQFDITNLAQTQRALEKIRPNVVINTAALADHELCESQPDLAHEINAVSAANLAKASAAIGARFVHISTDAVFDGSTGNYREDSTPAPFSVYGKTKLAGEESVLGTNADAVVARTNFFGWSPSTTRSVLEFFLNALERGNQVNGFTDYFVTSIYAQDLAEKLFELSHVSFAGLIHLVSRDAISKYEFGVEVARQWGLPSELIQPVGAMGGDQQVSRVRNLSLNTDLATDLLGNLMPSQQEGIESAWKDRHSLRELLSPL